MAPSTALVTGANRGIGFEICRQLARNGWKVTGSSRDPAKGAKAREELRSEGLAVDFVTLDLQDRDSIRSLPERLTAHVLDALIHNAAILPNSDDSIRVDPDVVEATLQTNLIGPLQLTQVLLPLLKRSADGRIIHLSSGMGAFSSMGSSHTAYRVSKTALNGLTATMALDLEPHGIKVFAMCPGWVRTAMGGAGAPRSPARGADTAVWLATTREAANGKFFRDRQVIPW